MYRRQWLRVYGVCLQDAPSIVHVHRRFSTDRLVLFWSGEDAVRLRPRKHFSILLKDPCTYRAGIAGFRQPCVLWYNFSETGGCVKATGNVWFFYGRFLEHALHFCGASQFVCTQYSLILISSQTTYAPHTMNTLPKKMPHNHASPRPPVTRPCTSISPTLF